MLAPAEVAEAVAGARRAAAPARGTWTVAPGESFWSIAEELLADHLGRPPTDAEMRPVLASA